MKAIEKVATELNITLEQAQEVIESASSYTNRGKGQVARNHKTTEKVADLFRMNPLWLSAELNEAVGWQFSQAVFWLRRAGWNIKTVALGGHQFAYQLISEPTN